jgi:hypothetical protein
MAPNPSTPHASHFQVRFHSLSRQGGGMAFPCDAAGHVDMDAMSERIRCNYLFARAMIGREFDYPVVMPA